MISGVAETLDLQQIRELIQNSVIWRDGGTANASQPFGIRTGA
jgi:hypothetical protein